MRIALTVNNPSRDLAGLTLLATELARRGVSCFLVPVALQRRELTALAPDFVLFNQLRPTNQPLIQRLIEAGMRVGLLDDEGGVFSSFNSYSRQFAPEVHTRHAVSLFCSWGPKLAEHAREHHWYRPDAIAVTGHPRFDFYAPSFRDVVLPDHPVSQHFSTPVVLINSRFSRANPAFSTREQQVREMVKERGFSLAEAQNAQNVMTQAMRDMAKMTNLLAERFPGITFVFRPHPSEQLETYRELLIPSDNLQLSRTGGIEGWLRLACAVIQRSCTTAIEAGMCGVPAFSPAWIPFPDIIESTERVSTQCSSQEELELYLDELQRGQFSPAENVLQAVDEVVQDWFCASDGKSHLRVADSIFRVAGREERAIDPTCCRQLYRDINTRASFARGLVGHLRRAIKREEKRRVRKWSASAKVFDSAQVRAIACAIATGNDPALQKSLRIETAVARPGFPGKHLCSVALLPG